MVLNLALSVSFLYVRYQLKIRISFSMENTSTIVFDQLLSSTSSKWVRISDMVSISEYNIRTGKNIKILYTRFEKILVEGKYFRLTISYAYKINFYIESNTPICFVDFITIFKTCSYYGRPSILNSLFKFTVNYTNFGCQYSVILYIKMKMYQ